MPTTVANNKIRDSFKAPQGTWSLCESTADQPSFDRDIYCAKLQGPVALFDGTSLNNRYYTRSLWEKVIRENNDKLAQEGLFGTLGHEQEVDEDALSEGKVTHKTGRLWINESDNTVHGELYILNSSSGRELNTYLRSGMRISTSSRAFGKFNGKTQDGADIIDEDGFHLQGFDFVLNPGVEAACPRIVESVTLEEKVTMDNTKELLESLTERSKLQFELSEATKGRDKAEKSLSEIVEQKSKVEAELTEAKTRLQWFAKNIGPKPIQAIRNINEGIAKWMLVPELAELAKEVGMFDTPGTSMEQAVSKLVESTKKYAALGSVPALTECLDMLESFKKCGSTPAKINKALDLLEAFMAIGKSPDELTAAFNEAKKARKVLNNARRIVAARKIRVGLNLHESKEPTIVEMLKKMSAKDVIASLKSLKKTNESKAPGKAPAAAIAVPTKVPTTKVREYGDASRALKLVESMRPYNPTSTNAK